MVANKKTKTIISARILLVLMFMAALTVALPLQVAQASFGSDMAQFLGCNDKNGDGLNMADCVSSSSQGPVTSFIDFKGDLTAPNSEGYAAGLTQAKDARTFILNVTNFALGFLGLIAVLIVIYGGFMSVISAGNPETAKKGRSAIMYAGIGLLLIMGSFAIVNTILLAPSNNEKGSTAQSALNSSSIRGVAGQQRFNYLANKIDDIMLKVFNDYQFYLGARQTMANARDTIGGYNEGACVVPLNNCVVGFQTLVNSQEIVLNNLINNAQANATFNTNMLALVNDINTLLVNGDDGLAATSGYIAGEGCNDTENTFADTNPCTEGQKNTAIGKISSLKAKIIAKINEKTFLAESYTQQLDTSAQMTAEVYQTLSGLASNLIGQQYFTILIPTFVKSPSMSLSDVKADGTTGFGQENTDTGKMLALTSDLTTIDQTAIKNILKSLMEIKSILQNMKFVNTIVSVDTASGNAPLIVNFSSVGSTDPSGYSITDDRIQWDLNGDGIFSGEANAFSGEGDGLMNCAEKNGATASCIFTKAGTYRVTLKIKPLAGKTDPATNVDWSQEIAPGISYIDILVNPPATKINLQAGPNSGEPRPVITYDDKTGTIKEDHDKIYFTLSEAKAGIKFDATKSTFSDGTTLITNDPSAKVRWNFGVPSPNNDVYAVPSEGTLSRVQEYPAIGNYQVRFEVMDKNNVTDRKIFTVVVSNVAPRITNPPATGKLGDEMTFDGSNSTSDGGQIIFNWKIEKIATGGKTTTAFVDNIHNWMLNKAYAALADPNTTLSKPTASAVQTQTAPVQTLEPTKRSESTDDYDCQMPEGKDDILKCTFKKAGSYRVTLSLDDQGVAREESTIITIKSTPPTASFHADKLTDSAPALYKLDASTYSFDPDEKDNSNLEYSWEVNPANCVLVGFADQNTEADLIQTSADAFSSQTPCSKLKDFNSNTGQPVIKFTQKGNYTVNLVVRTADETDLPSDPYEQNITVDNVLDVAWGEMKPSAILEVPGATGTGADQVPSAVNQQPVAPITFIFNSSQAISYDLDFGDGIDETGEMVKGTPKEVVHKYDKTGKYTAKLSVFDADDVENSISRKIFIGDSNQPVAIITVNVDGSETEPTDLNLDNGKTIENVVVVNRKNNLSFDAGKSLNTDGTGRRLKYSWNINDNEKQSTNREVSYQFSNTSDQDTPYVVKLKVTSEKDATQVGEDSVNILVVGEQPTLRSLTAVPDSSTMVTPVSVKVTAVGAQDADGQIVQYKWWYYDANKPPSPDERLGLQITTTNTAVLTIGTRGLEGEKPKYSFGVEMTDNDNLTVSTDAQNDNQKLNIMPPLVQVTNGPNKAPVARFTVDRTSVNVGDTVNFSSTSFDPDAGGGIQEYKWDFGDGTKGENKASVSHIYQKANVDGYKVKLTVVDNNFSEATSDTVRIFVDAQAQPPVPGFTSAQVPGSKTINFTNTSTADEAAGATITKYSWDFNVAVDSNGDGKSDNDIDSGDQNPSTTYADYGIYRAKLTVEDSQGQSRSVTNFVNVKPPVSASSAAPAGGATGNINEGASNSANKTAGANLFEASNKVDLGLLAGSLGAYAILLLLSRMKKTKMTNK